MIKGVSKKPLHKELESGRGRVRGGRKGGRRKGRRQVGEEVCQGGGRSGWRREECWEEEGREEVGKIGLGRCVTIEKRSRQFLPKAKLASNDHAGFP